jgi:hypothetical protein
LASKYVPVHGSKGRPALLNEGHQDHESRSDHQNGDDKRAERSSSSVPVSRNQPLVPGMDENGDHRCPPERYEEWGENSKEQVAEQQNDGVEENDCDALLLSG